MFYELFNARLSALVGVKEQDVRAVVVHCDLRSANRQSSNNSLKIIFNKLFLEKNMKKVCYQGSCPEE
jgi:hypothetical protein